MTAYLKYWRDMLRCALAGSSVYYAWTGFLLVVTSCGLAMYIIQIQVGLGVTNLSQQVSWGAYIANFTFLVGVAAAAVLLVVPAYVYHRSDIKSVVLIAELLAASAIIMCLLFVTVDLGRPDRFIHMLPFVGRLNFPRSMLAWDVIVLAGYLVLNLHVPGYLLYRLYQGRQPSKAAYLPFVAIAVVWAVSIHTVTAFLYGGFGGRPFWNTAIMAPRFLVSAFASGPAILILVFLAIDRFTEYHIEESIIGFLRRVVSITLPINFFLLGCELFKELYTDSVHAASAHYLFVGLHDHGMLVPYIWSGLAMGLFAMAIFWARPLYRDRRWLIAGSILCVIGVWIEKGMGLIIPGFIPSPTGDLVEYQPSAPELVICLGIWALGALLFTIMAKVALAIQHGELRADPE